jgi:hypothetical protein
MKSLCMRNEGTYSGAGALRRALARDVAVLATVVALARTAKAALAAEATAEAAATTTARGALARDVAHAAAGLA